MLQLFVLLHRISCLRLCEEKRVARTENTSNVHQNSSRDTEIELCAHVDRPKYDRWNTKTGWESNVRTTNHDIVSRAMTYDDVKRTEGCGTVDGTGGK